MGGLFVHVICITSPFSSVIGVGEVVGLGYRRGTTGWAGVGIETAELPVAVYRIKAGVNRKSCWVSKRVTMTGLPVLTGVGEIRGLERGHLAPMGN